MEKALDFSSCFCPSSHEKKKSISGYNVTADCCAKVDHDVPKAHVVFTVYFKI